MNCKVCGSSEFVTNDGITYCTECQSQIEETQAEIAVDQVFSRDLGSKTPKKSAAADQKKKEYGDWITVECYNHILFMQVSALINLGASPKLKNTVLHIWTQYLQRCEIAFRIDYQAKDGKPHLSLAPHKRDLCVIYGQKPAQKRKRKRSTASDSEVSESPANETSASETESETDSAVSENSNTRIHRRYYSFHARKQLRRKRPATKNNECINSVHNMTLAKTLSMCYLGLLYTKDQLTLCDFIRLVNEEKVPFLNLQAKLPLKLQQSDCGTFCTYTVPDAYIILKSSHEIAQFTKLPEIKESSISLAAARLVKDLNLPIEMLPIVNTLIEKYKEKAATYTFQKIKFECIPQEYLALACILVAMKMLFILDDKFEVEHSSVMKKLNTANPGHNYFVWEEWKKQSVIKEYLFLCEKPGYAALNKLDCLSADSIISKYPFPHLDSTSLNVSNLYVPKHTIMSVLDNVVTIPESSHSIPTSFPLRHAVRCFIEEWKTLPMFSQTQDIDFTLLSKDFSSRSLSFNPLQFDQEDELCYLLMTSLYFPEEAVGLSKQFSRGVTHCQRVIRTTSKYWFFNPEASHRVRKTDIAVDWFDKLPSSFKWLLGFVSKYAYCNNFVLYNEMNKIEKILLLNKRLITSKVKCDDKLIVGF